MKLLQRFKAWRKEGVRALKWGEYYIRVTPNLGAALPLSKTKRIRWAPHHGLQLVVWRRDRWVVGKQLLGKSKVRGEQRAAIF